ncbi:MAG TPA: molybdopterin converting factor subunit 1 [Pseudomonadales bacterium]
MSLKKSLKSKSLKVIKLLYFASIREALDSQGESLDYGEHCQDISSLLEYLKSRGAPWPTLLGASTPVLVAVNQVIAQNNEPIQDGDEVAFFPPVTGG